jgi:hypothetical protein
MCCFIFHALLSVCGGLFSLYTNQSPLFQGFMITYGIVGTVNDSSSWETLSIVIKSTQIRTVLIIKKVVFSVNFFIKTRVFCLRALFNRILCIFSI